MLYTGMRISDVATFDTSLRLNGNEIFVRMHKTKKELYTWVPDWLVNRLRDRERLYGPRIFALSKSHSLSVKPNGGVSNCRRFSHWPANSMSRLFRTNFATHLSECYSNAEFLLEMSLN